MSEKLSERAERSRLALTGRNPSWSELRECMDELHKSLEADNTAAVADRDAMIAALDSQTRLLETACAKLGVGPVGTCGIDIEGGAKTVEYPAFLENDIIEAGDELNADNAALRERVAGLEGLEAERKEVIAFVAMAYGMTPPTDDDMEWARNELRKRGSLDTPPEESP